MRTVAVMRSLLLLLAIASAPGIAEERVAVDSTLYRGESTPTSIETLLADPEAIGFERLDGRAVVASPGTDHWFVIDIAADLAERDRTREWMLRIDFTGLDALDVFVADGRDLLYEGSVGDEVPLGRWPLSTRLPTVPLSVDGRTADRVFLRPEPTGQPLVLPLVLVDAAAERADARIAQLWYGFFFGAALALVAYTACLWFATRAGSYLAFAVYLGAFTLVIATTSGIGRLWLWPSVEGFTTRFSLAMISLTTAAMTVFVGRFLQLAETSPRWHRTLQLWAAAVLLPALALPFVPYMRVQPVLHAITLLTMLVLAAVSLSRLRRGSRPAAFLVLVYAVLFTAIVLELLRYNGLIPSNFVSEHFMEVAVLFEALVLCVGLADNISAIRARHAAAEVRERAARERYTGQLIAAHESERRRFGAILHDDIGHGVATLRYGLAQAITTEADASPSRTILARLHEDCGTVLENLRRLARESHPHLLSQLGLGGALRSLFGDALNPLGVEWIVTCETKRLPRDVEEHLYRIAQECLTNAIKHAEPARVTVRIDRTGDTLAFRYEDDGVGADPGVFENADTAGGFGLVSISRARPSARQPLHRPHRTGRRLRVVHRRHLCHEARRRWTLSVASCWSTITRSSGRAFAPSSRASRRCASSPRRTVWRAPWLSRGSTVPTPHSSISACPIRPGWT